MIRLLTGPAGSGKTFRVLSEFSKAVRAGSARLLAPTATLQRHLQNELARQGHVFRSSAVSTLSVFMKELAPDVEVVSAEFFHLMVAEAVRSVRAPEFDKVREMPGFHAQLAGSIQDLDAAGVSPEMLRGLRREIAPFQDAVAAVWHGIQRQMCARKMTTRGEVLRAIAVSLESRELPARIWIDGFAQFSAPEIELIRALGDRVEVTLTLPDEGVPRDLKRTLLDAGCVEERLTGGHAPAVTVTVPESIERESEEIARRILELHASGTPFREMGVMVRQPAKYDPLLAGTFERFGIPAHFYSGERLSKHPAARLMADTIEALLAGWEHQQVLALLRSAPLLAGSKEFDSFDVNVRERLPGQGLPALISLAGNMRPLSRLLRSLEAIGDWSAVAWTSAVWADKFASLPALFRPATIPDGVSREQARLYRSRAEGLDGFMEAAVSASNWFGADAKAMRLQEFWRVTKALMALLPVKSGHHARDVVHVVSAYEARQWDFSAAFVCGLVEKEFPAQTGRDPFFSDRALRQLHARTSVDREEDERNLFEAMRVRARHQVVLTYPRIDARGQRTLPSIFLKNLPVEKVPIAVRPALPEPVAPWRQPSRLRTPDLLANLAANHTTFSVTALESLLQCPFQFFSKSILRVEERPLRPEDRLNFLLQGNIVHETLKEWFADRPPIEPLFHRVYARLSREKHLQDGYRSERARRVMLVVLKRFAEMMEAEPRVEESLVEQKFEFAIDPDLILRGRMDRIDKLADGRAIVVDYKYSTAVNTKSKVGDETRLQGPLYALALREQFGIEPAGMMYVSLKGEKPEYFGWGEVPNAARDLTDELMRESVVRVRSAVAEFRSGAIHPQPLNTDPCRYCDVKDACRVKEQEMAMSLSILPVDGD